MLKFIAIYIKIYYNLLLKYIVINKILHIKKFSAIMENLLYEYYISEVDKRINMLAEITSLYDLEVYTQKGLSIREKEKYL